MNLQQSETPGAGGVTGADGNEDIPILHENNKLSSPIPDQSPRKFNESVLWNFLQANEYGDAQLFIHLQKDQYVYDHSSGLWYRWNDHYWKNDLIKNVISAVDSVIEVYGVEMFRQDWSAAKARKAGREKEADVCEKKAKAYRKRIESLQTLKRRKTVVEMSAIGPESLGISGDEWDCKPWLLPVKNGVIDLKSGELRPGCQTDMLKTFCAVSYIPHARCPRFEKFLAEIFNKILELVFFAQRLLGMSLIGEVLEHIIPIFWGLGRNGKDSLLEAIHYVLGDLAGPVRAEMLMDCGLKKNPGAPNAEIMALRGKRLVWASETGDGKKIDAATVKLITGGGHLSGRAPYGKHEVSFKPSHTICLMTNNKPRINSDDFAIWNRVKLIPFEISFVENPQKENERKRDKNLQSALKSESEGILAWLVQGCLEYQKSGLNPPEIVLNATKSYQKDEDILNQFYEDICFLGPDAWATSAAILSAYEQWAPANGFKPMSAANLGRKLGKKFKNSTRRIDGKTQKIWQGIGLKDVTY
jgi:putative DNA primase/helicase